MLDFDPVFFATRSRAERVWLAMLNRLGHGAGGAHAVTRLVSLMLHDGLRVFSEKHLEMAYLISVVE